MPKEWKAALEQEDRAEVEETLANGQQVLEEATPETAMTAHAEHFHLLLWAEEWQLVLDLHNFDLVTLARTLTKILAQTPILTLTQTLTLVPVLTPRLTVTLTPILTPTLALTLNPNPNQVDDKATVLHVRGAEHILHVRGLAEKRPSVLRGDQVRANLPGERSRVWRGRAGQIEMEDVHLRFAPSFPYVDGQLVEISFMLGRTPLRLFHQGLDLVRELRPSILFPEPLRADQLRAPREQRGPHQWFNPSVQGNPQQCMAVAAVVGGQGRHVPYIIFGPPGTGKTTTIGKLAHRLVAEGKSVMLAAGDTFRAAAIEQLSIWANRTGCPVVAKESGSDASGLVYEAIERARSAGSDVLLIDTAGRLHNKANLMAELEKIQRVIQKLDATAPHEVLLTIDATTGQNAIAQVETFGDMVSVTGLVLTKLDGTAKGGVLVALAEHFQLPVRAIGVGEGIDDLRPFSARAFARNLMGFDAENPTP